MLWFFLSINIYIFYKGMCFYFICSVIFHFTYSLKFSIEMRHHLLHANTIQYNKVPKYWVVCCAAILVDVSINSFGLVSVSLYLCLIGESNRTIFYYSILSSSHLWIHECNFKNRIDLFWSWVPGWCGSECLRNLNLREGFAQNSLSFIDVSRNLFLD